ncbi:MAG: hypothetical protein ACK41E_02335 [Deinococcales bacterium]
MKYLFAPLLLLGFALAAPGGTTFKQGVFFATVGTDAKVQIGFKFGENLLFNRAGESILTLESGFLKKPLELKLEKGTPFKGSPNDYHSALETVSTNIRVPVGTKAGTHVVKLFSEVFLCDNLTKVCYIDRSEGSFEIRVGKGKDQPLLIEFSRPSR